MPDFLIRDLDEVTMRKLRERAERNRRSLQAEIKHVLTHSVKLSKEESIELMRRTGERMAKYDLPDSTRLLREDRDR